MADIKAKIMAWLRAIRIKFVIAYVLLGIGGLVIGSSLEGNMIDFKQATISLTIIIISAIGIHYRDEASDWIAGFDKENGGVGVIREGFLKARALQVVGGIFNIISLGLAIIQVFLVHQLIYIIVPVSAVILGANYFTEQIFLGHEIGPALSFTMSFLWVYLAQGWFVSGGIIWFTIFLLLITFVLVPYQDVGDYEADKKSGKKTLTVKMGIDGVGQFMIFLALIALVILFISIRTMLSP